MGVLDEAADQLVQAVARPDRVARDDRDAAHDAIGEERRLVGREEVRLVGAEHEGSERVDAPGVDERARHDAFALLLHDAVAPGRDPARDYPQGGRDAEQQDREREPVAERTDQVR